MTAPALTWRGIARLGLVQTCLGAIVVIMTSTINRVMVVELALPAFIPGALIALHYGVQVLRPRWGHGSDMGGRRTPWIVGGMAVLAAGGVGAALSVMLIASHQTPGILCAAVSFLAVGMGVGAAGTSVLVLLASRVAPEKRAAAATTVWVMMIAGFAVTAPLAGHFLEPYSPERLVLVTACVAVIAVCLAALAIRGVEGQAGAQTAPAHARAPFAQAIREVWGEPRARRFTIFIFISMLAYSGQELILEPFAGVVFGMTPGATTKLSGVQHGGVLFGMIFVSLAATLIGGRILGSLRMWTVAGCAASALALGVIALGGMSGPDFPLRAAVGALGFSNGVFAVAAIGSMMALANAGREAREGTRMGLWGAAQGIAFGAGGFAGTVAVDIARHFAGPPVNAYALVFLAEAALFIFAALLAARIGEARAPARERAADPSHSIAAAT